MAEDISDVDEKAARCYLTATAARTAKTRTYMHFYRANLDGSGMKLLDPGDASHAVSMSDSGKLFRRQQLARQHRARSRVLYDAQGADGDGAGEDRPRRR